MFAGVRHRVVNLSELGVGRTFDIRTTSEGYMPKLFTDEAQ